MNPSPQRPAPEIEDFAPTIHAALGLLLEEWAFACELKCSPWDFAVEHSDLRAVGLTGNQLRWLLLRNYVEPRIETTQVSKGHRTFRKFRGCVFTDRTCFVLTEAGAALARKALPWPAKDSHVDASDPPVPQDLAVITRVVPQWDPIRRELRLGRRVVKQFRQPAPAQETILAAFQEQGWPPCIGDPLPPKAEQDAKQYLRNTIKNLNRNQRNRRIRFIGHGNGHQVRWELSR